MSTEVSVYIPAYNAEKTIEISLNSVLNQTLVASEIIVIDDNSSDKTVELINKYSEVKLIKNQSNFGLGFNRNLAINNSNNEFVASIDADVELNKDWLEILVDKLNEEKTVMCGGRMYEKHISVAANSWRAKYYSQNWGSVDKINPNFLFGCNTILKKKNWRQVNGYDENLKTNGEDIDFSNKLKQIPDVNLYYSSKAICYHLQNDTTDTLSKRIWRYHSFGYKIKKPSIYKLTKLSIKQFKFLVKRIFENLFKLNFNFIYISFVVFIKFVKHEIIYLLKYK